MKPRYVYANATLAGGIFPLSKPLSLTWRTYFRLIRLLPGLHRRTHLLCYGAVACGAYKYAKCSCWKTFGADPYRMGTSS